MSIQHASIRINPAYGLVNGPGSPIVQKGYNLVISSILSFRVLGCYSSFERALSALNALGFSPATVED
jgi:hypothetical protein